MRRFFSTDTATAKYGTNLWNGTIIPTFRERKSQGSKTASTMNSCKAAGTENFLVAGSYTRIRRTHSRHISLFPFRKNGRTAFPSDPGLNNPLAALWFAVDYDDNVYVVYEHFAAGKDIDYHAAEIKRICSNLDWHTDGRGRICALIDSAAKQHTLSGVKSVCELFYERDILVNPDVDKDLFSGISRVKSYLNEKNGLPNLYIFSSCVNLIREFKGYFWGNGDVPKKTDDHALDALRYFLMSRPKKLPPEPEKSLIQKDKERRWRQISARRFTD